MDKAIALIWATLLWLQTLGATVIYVDPFFGVDNITCGDVISPCKTLECSWTNYLWSSNITGHVIFSLKPGNYFVDKEKHYSLSYKCSDHSITSLDIQLDESM